MLKETYKAKLKEMRKKNPNAEFIEVTRSRGHLLSPSWDLLKRYKQDHDWDIYKREFIAQMDNDKCLAEMRRIWDLSQKKDVYLVCYEPPGQNCHRHLLINMMRIRFGEHPDTSPPLKG